MRVQLSNSAISATHRLHFCRYTSFDGIDVTRLLALINKTFDKTLKRDYMESLEGRLHSVYLSEG